MSSLVPMIPMMPKTQVMPRMMKILKVKSLIYSDDHNCMSLMMTLKIKRTIRIDYHEYDVDDNDDYNVNDCEDHSWW